VSDLVNQVGLPQFVQRDKDTADKFVAGLSVSLGVQALFPHRQHGNVIGLHRAALPRHIPAAAGDIIPAKVEGDNYSALPIAI